MYQKMEMMVFYRWFRSSFLIMFTMTIVLPCTKGVNIL